MTLAESNNIINLVYAFWSTCDEPFWFGGWQWSLQARRRISSTVKAIIEERRGNVVDDDDDDDSGNSSSGRSDFLEILLCVDTLSEDEKVSFVLDSLLGGYETTFLLMAMMVYFLGDSNVALQQLKVLYQFQIIYSLKWGFCHAIFWPLRIYLTFI